MPASSQSQLHLQLNLLGKPEILLNGQPLQRMPSRASEAILIYLVCQRQPMSREALYALFWPESTEKQAKANFRAALSQLRKQVGDYLIISRQSVAFDHTLLYVLDINTFEREVEAALSKSGALMAGGATALQSTLTLYRGPFLAGFSLNLADAFNEWVTQQRERWRWLASLALKRLVDYLENTGIYDNALNYNSQLLELNPLNEGAYRRQMWLLARQGRGGEAGLWAEKCRQQLASQLSTILSPATAATVHEIEALTWPPPYRVPAFDPTVVHVEDGLVKRLMAVENAGILTLLSQNKEKVTQLAIAAVHEICRQYPGRFLHGIFLLDMAAVANSASFALKLGEVVAGEMPAKGNIIATTKEALRERELLLILTNFDHLVEDDVIINFLLDLIATKSKLCFVAITQVRLNLQAEQVMLFRE